MRQSKCVNTDPSSVEKIASRVQFPLNLSLAVVELVDDHKQDVTTYSKIFMLMLNLLLTLFVLCATEKNFFLLENPLYSL